MPKVKNPVNDILYDGLTKKEWLFCNEYINNGGNGTQSALKVYACKDYGVGASIASENLKKQHIKEYLIGKLANNEDALKRYVMQEYTKDIASNDKTLRTNALNQVARIVIPVKTHVVSEQIREQNEITYPAFNERTDAKRDTPDA